MKLIFGLGNPGRKYFSTRHNIGCRVVDELGRKLGISFKKKVSSLSLSGRGRFKNEPLVLAKPLTFMNESGRCLKLLAAGNAISPENILVVYDDIDLPFGAIRLRIKGSAGTHKGMKSCIEYLETPAFPRLRVGIRGERESRDLSEYVLENFTEEEEAALKDVLASAAEKILTEFLNCSKV